MESQAYFNFLFKLIPIKWLLQRLTEPKIEAILQQSDNYYQPNQFISNWTQLNEYLKFDFILKNTFSSMGNSRSIIKIINISDKFLDKIRVKVKATCYKYSEVQEYIEFTDLKPQGIYSKELPQDFLIHLISLDDGSYLKSFDSIKVKTELIICDGIEQQFNDQNIDYISCRHGSLLEYWNWTEHQGKLYNIRFLNRVQYNFKQKIAKLGFGKLFLNFIEQLQVLKAIFWLLLITDLYEISNDAQLVRKTKNH